MGSLYNRDSEENEMDESMDKKVLKYWPTYNIYEALIFYDVWWFFSLNNVYEFFI